MEVIRDVEGEVAQAQALDDLLEVAVPQLRLPEIVRKRYRQELQRRTNLCLMGSEMRGDEAESSFVELEGHACASQAAQIHKHAERKRERERCNSQR